MRLMPCVDATIWILWGARSHDFAKFPVLFPVCREFGSGDAFDLDCVHHHPASVFSTSTTSETLAC
jgi:hypothetical protein